MPLVHRLSAELVGTFGWYWVAAEARGSLAANGFGEHSPGGYTLGSALVTEIVMTAMFLLIILGVTDKRAPARR